MIEPVLFIDYSITNGLFVQKIFIDSHLSSELQKHGELVSMDLSFLLKNCVIIYGIFLNVY